MSELLIKSSNRQPPVRIYCKLLHSRTLKSRDIVLPRNTLGKGQPSGFPPGPAAPNIKFPSLRQTLLPATLKAFLSTTADRHPSHETNSFPNDQLSLIKMADDAQVRFSPFSLPTTPPFSIAVAILRLWAQAPGECLVVCA